MGATLPSLPMAQNSVEQWFRGLPPVTRWHFASVVIVTLGGNFGLVNPISIALLREQIFQKFEIWRLVTNLMFMGKLGFGFLIHLLFLYQHSTPLEQFVDSQGQGDYLFFLMFTALVLNGIGMLFEIFFCGTSLIMGVIYYWSRVHPQAQGEVSFMFGLKFQGVYLPWVLTAFTVLMGGDPKPALAGIAAAHLFYFLKDVYPQEHHGQKLIWTPMFMRQLFNPAARDPNTNAFGGHRWGGGQRLG